jgi:ERCC4-type nuclease
MITFKIDAREHKLKHILMQSIDCEKSLTFLSIECDNLYCGDFIIEIDKVPIVVIERKTLPDLVLSIRDGRYKTQKAKIKEHYLNSSIIYLIEGSFDYNPTVPLYIEGMEKYSVISSIINTQIRDKINVIHTNNLEDTFDFLLALLIRVCKNPAKYKESCGNGIEVRKEDFIKKQKINNKQDMFFFQLTQVPGISAKTAEAFVAKYNNMMDFYKTFVNMNNEEKLKTLKSITIDDTNNNKSRKINSKVAENIVKYMF